MNQVIPDCGIVVGIGNYEVYYPQPRKSASTCMLAIVKECANIQNLLIQRAKNLKVSQWFSM